MSIAGVSGAHDLGMTTNGMLLERLAQPLKDAGLKRVNVHLDSLNEERVKKLMRFVDLDAVWRGVRAAEVAGLTPMKMNAVIARGWNETMSPSTRPTRPVCPRQARRRRPAQRPT